MLYVSGQGLFPIIIQNRYKCRPSLGPCLQNAKAQNKKNKNSGSSDTPPAAVLLACGPASLNSGLAPRDFVRQRDRAVAVIDPFE